MHALPQRAFEPPVAAAGSPSNKRLESGQQSNRRAVDG
jgi:hypothetical protein